MAKIKLWAAMLRWATGGPLAAAPEGRWLCDTLTRCGPVYVKAGQIMSTRADVFPSEITTALSQLQDNVAPMEEVDVRAVLREAGMPLDETFRCFDATPLAAASIGQVHRAVLMDGHRPVAVKVQRPGLLSAVRNDAAVLGTVLRVLDRIGLYGMVDAQVVLGQWTRQMCQELDFQKEADNMVRFRRSCQHMWWLCVPEPLRCTRQVLVMELVEADLRMGGSELASQMITWPLERRARLVARMVRIVRHSLTTGGGGVLHADLHPGNVWLRSTDDDSVVLYDFGSCIDISPKLSACFRQVLTELESLDVERALDVVVSSGYVRLKQEADPSEVLSVLDALVKKAEVAGMRADPSRYTRSTGGGEGIVALEAFTGSNSPYIFDPRMVGIIRVLMQLHNMCQTMLPGYNWIGALRETGATWTQTANNRSSSRPAV